MAKKMATKHCRPRRRRHEPLRKPARPPRLRARPQQQAAAEKVEEKVEQPPVQEEIVVPAETTQEPVTEVKASKKKKTV